MLALGEVPLFQTLGKRDLRRVAKLAETRRYYGSTVCRAGTQGDALYVVLDGTAEVKTPQGSVTSPRGRRRLRRAGPDRRGPPGGDGDGAGEVTVARIPRAGFATLLREEPAIAVGLMGGLARIIRDVQAHEGASCRRDRRGDARHDVGSGRRRRSRRRSRSAGCRPSRRCPSSRRCPKRHLGRVVRLAELRRYGPGAAVVRAGAPGDAFHIVLDGHAEVRPTVGRGRTLAPATSSASWRCSTARRAPRRWSRSTSSPPLAWRAPRS